MLVAQAASADILSWRDAGGVRHLTNRIETIPPQYCADAEVFVTIAPEPAAPAPVAESAPPAPAPAPITVTDLDEAYRAGMLAGAQLGGGGGGGGGGGAATGGAVDLTGPLAVTNVHVDSYADGVGWPEPYLWPYEYPLVTTGFDRGRSRHQTVRMLLQEQFQIDRNGPFAYARWSRPGLGPQLAPFLPRGLPLPVQQFGRVLYR